MTDRKTGPVLVVTPTLGRSPFLAEALHSVHHVGIPVQHVIVVPAEHAATVGQICPRCTIVIDERPRGIYHAIERGVRGAQPWEWMTYLNDDDLLTPAFGEVASEHMRHASVDTIAFGDVRWISGSGGNLGRMPVARRDGQFRDLIMQGISPLTQQGTLTNRVVYSRLGGFDTRYRLAADLDFWVRALLAGFRFKYYPRELANWRIHAAQASQNRELAAEELRFVVSLFPERPSRMALVMAALTHAIANANRYMERLRWSGTLRSATLFARAATGDPSSKPQRESVIDRTAQR